MKVTFYGGVETVTGSKFLVEAKGTRLLVDCGLFQGLKMLRKRNWSPPPLKLKELHGIALTHAHLDHSGYLPVVVREGYSGEVFVTPATRQLLRILLPDAAHLQEEEAKWANRRGSSRHQPALPLYNQADAKAALEQLRSRRFGERWRVGALELSTQRAGHILGAASLRVSDGETSVLFSGDLGRPNDILIPPPEPPGEVDWIVMESTYGGRFHEEVDLIEELAKVVTRTVERRGILLIPSFAVGRAQAILYALLKGFEAGLAPRTTVYMNSPMSTDVTKLYEGFPEDHRLSPAECVRVCQSAHFVSSVDESVELCRKAGPHIVISASGMMTGGRVLFHLQKVLPDARNTVLLPGYMAPGTRGAHLKDGASEIKVFGERLPVAAEVCTLDGFSAHADEDELVAWLGERARRPKGVILVHGEPTASDALRLRIERELGWRVEVPGYRDSITL